MIVPWFDQGEDKFAISVGELVRIPRRIVLFQNINVNNAPCLGEEGLSSRCLLCFASGPWGCLLGRLSFVFLDNHPRKEGKVAKLNLKKHQEIIIMQVIKHKRISGLDT